MQTHDHDGDDASGCVSGGINHVSGAGGLMRRRLPSLYTLTLVKSRHGDAVILSLDPMG